MFLVIVSCANPTVVNVIGPNDSKMNCEELSAEILKANKYMGTAGRILVRKSGTEPKIRIMAESNDKKLNLKCIKIIKKSLK